MHYKTNKQMPDNLIKRIIKSKNLHIAVETLYQLTLATADLLMNTAYDRFITNNN